MTKAVSRFEAWKELDLGWRDPEVWAAPPETIIWWRPYLNVWYHISSFRFLTVFGEKSGHVSSWNMFRSSVSCSPGIEQWNCHQLNEVKGVLNGDWCHGHHTRLSESKGTSVPSSETEVFPRGDWINTDSLALISFRAYRGGFCVRHRPTSTADNWSLTSSPGIVLLRKVRDATVFESSKILRDLWRQR
jgi:hypothetical protein